MMPGIKITLSASLLLLLTGTQVATVSGQPFKTGLTVNPDNPRYWKYHGKPVLLLGASDEDNLFQLPGLEAQLDLLQSVGGNYVRNTMSSRDPGNEWPFLMDTQTGKYNLDRWNDAYWNRFSRFLELTHERQIFVQIEVWATFDFYRENWDANPFNPKNNSSYTAFRTKLPEEVPTHPTLRDNPFFWSIPNQHNNMTLLAYQQLYVDKLLSYTLKYDHVLYCIDNETSVTSEWGKFWSTYIRKRALEEGTRVHVTEMWDPWDLNHVSHRESFDHPELYSFVEISQNNHQRGENQWNNGLKQIRRLERTGMLRPVHNVKTYGSRTGTHGGGTHNGIGNFIRSVLFGSAAVRFHRPPAGLGLGDTAQAVVQGMRQATDRIRFFEASLHNDLLEERKEDEAYCRAIPGSQYLVYFPDSGEVSVRLFNLRPGSIKRLDILNREWSDVELPVEKGILRLSSEGKHILYVIQ